MIRKFMTPVLLFICGSFCTQEINKIEFRHSNTIILFKSVNIILEPIQNNKKGKVKVLVKKDNDGVYISRISKDKYFEICYAIKNIKGDTIAVKHNMIDGSSTHITMYDNLGTEKNFHATGLNKKSQSNEFQKDFWSATKLIIRAAKLQMEDLIDYR